MMQLISLSTNWQPLWVTFKLAAITTFLLFLIALPLANFLANSKSKIKPFIEALVSMPLVLPPTVLGFYFLVAFSTENGLGYWLDQWFGLQLIFSFSGLVIASIIYSLPFMVHPIQSGLSTVPNNLKEASYTLGKSKFETFLKVILPNIKPSLLSGIVLAFAHTIGEFGIVLMIGGSIPGETKVASIAIYEEVEAMNYGQANSYSSVLFILSFSILLLVYTINGGYFKRFWR